MLRKFLFAVGLLALCLFTGCRYFEYQTNEGRTARYVNFGFDTKLDDLEVTTPDGVKVTVRNLDTNSQALQVVGKALEKIP